MVRDRRSKKQKSHRHEQGRVAGEREKKTLVIGKRSGHQPIYVASRLNFWVLDRPTPSHVTSVRYDCNLRVEFHDGFTDDLARGDESVRSFRRRPQLRVPARALTVPRLWLGTLSLGFPKG